MRDAFQNLADKSLISERTADVMRKAVGFRNRAVHEYNEINWAVVHDIATHRRDDFRAFLRELARDGHLAAQPVPVQQHAARGIRRAAQKKHRK